MEVTGPAAGIDLLKTSEDPTGTRVLGTINNCAGGKSPWGTALTGEENFQQYFANLPALAEDDPLRSLHDRYGVGEAASERRWEEFHSRFDLAQEPNEPLRFGWVVEFDPYDPASTPKKRTALGRVKHEGATSAVAPGVRSPSTPVMTSALTTPTSSSPAARTTRTIAPPMRICSTRARSTSPSSTTTARASGCRWCMARGR